MTSQRDQLAEALLTSFGGSWYLRRSRALQHADALIAAGFGRPRFLTSADEVAELPEGAVVERTVAGAPPEFFVKRDSVWHSIDDSAPVSTADLGGPGAWLALRR